MRRMSWFGAAVAAALLVGCGPSIPEKIPDKMVYVQPGAFVMGSNEGGPDERPARDVEIKEGFFVDQHEVTNGDYKKFVDETGHKPPPHWKGNEFPANKADHPVSNVSFQDAAAYCQWRSNKDKDFGLKYRLPSEEEWEYVARGPKGDDGKSRIYPWGDNLSADKGNFASGDTRSVGYSGGGASEWEMGKGKNNKGLVYDLAGNVWEWTDSWYQGGSTFKVIKGGGYTPDDTDPRSSKKGQLEPAARELTVGFRCVANVKSE